MADQQSKLSIVIDSRDAEARIERLRQRLRELSDQTDETGDNTDDLGRRQRRTSDETNRLGDRSNSAKKALDDLAKGAAIAGAAIGGGLFLAVRKAQSFETAMAEVNKTVDFTTENGLQDLKKELIELTRVIPLPFEELAAIAAAGGQGGIADKQLGKYTETIAKMAIAFDIAAGETSDSMAKIANVFKTPIENIGDLGDAINTLSNNMASKAPEIIDFMLRVGNSATAMNISAEATAALGSSLVSLGLSQEVAGTAMASMLTTLLDSESWSKSAAGAFSDLGLATDEFAQLVANDGVAALLQLRDAIMALPKDQQIPYLSQMFGVAGVKAAGLFTSLDMLDDALAMVGEGSEKTTSHLGSMQAEFEKMADTSANAEQLFFSMVDTLRATVGEAFLPVVNQLMRDISPLIDKITVWAAANPELLRSITILTGGLLGSIVGIKLFADAVAGSINMFNNLKTAFDGLKAGIALIGAPMAIAIVAIVALIAIGVLLYKNWDTVKQKASELGDWLAGIWSRMPAPLQEAASNIASIFQGIWGAVKGYLGFIVDVYRGTFDSFADMAMGGLTAAWAVIKGVFGAIGVFISAGVQTFAVLFNAGFSLIKNTVSTIFNAVKALLKGDIAGMVSIIGAGLGNAVKIVGTMLKQLFDVFKGSATKLYQIGKDMLTGLINGIKQGASGAINAVTTMASNMVSAVKTRLDIHSPSRVMDKIGQHTAAGMAQGIKKGRKTVKSEAQKMADDAIKATQDAIATMQRDLALFGNTSKVVEYQYDISTGKYGGNTSLLLELARQVDAQKEEAAVIADVLAMKREVYNLTTPYVTELSKVTYELEAIEGKYRNVNDQQKEWLLNAAQELDAYRLANTARASILDLDRQMSLLGNDSMFSALAYDLMDANNQLSELSDTMKDEWLTKVAAFEDAKKVTDITKDIEKSLESINREIALMDDSSGLAAFAYDLNNTDKYAKAYAEDLNELGAAIERLDLLKAQKSSQTAFDSLLSDLRGGTEIDKLNEQYRDKLIVIEQFEAAHTDLLGEALEARYQLTNDYTRAMGTLITTQTEGLFDSLASASKDMLSEQSRTYRALFFLQQSAAIASAGISMYKSISDMMAIGTTLPQKLAGAAAIASKFATIIGSVKSVAAPIGQAHDGIMSVPKSGTWNLEKGERVLPAHTAKAMDKKLAEGGNSEINITVNVDAKGNSNMTGEQSSTMGRQMAQGIRVVVQDVIRKEKRQGGMLYGA